ncbi:unnamed protein product [Ilex paraguariensis]|uniref:Uncharacterized protein n=1 Tax=Ilex paraguariensis TaxID=185542 RepID=A0ABC8SYX0_9AQUA
MRAPCCQKMGLKKGPWSPEEDHILISYIEQYGHDNWRALPKEAGLLRCGKSCRLRWTNYLRPDIKRGNFSKEEEETIIRLHQNLGNRWSAIATKLPGRTDNEIKNFWHTHLKKKEKQTFTTLNLKGHSIDSTRWETNDARLLEPAKFSGHMRFHNLSYTQNPSQRSSENFLKSERYTATTKSETEEGNINASMNIPEINVLKTTSISSISRGVVDPRPQSLYPAEISTQKSVDGVNMDISKDMVFWYSLFIRAGGNN